MCHVLADFLRLVSLYGSSGPQRLYATTTATLTAKKPHQRPTGSTRVFTKFSLSVLHDLFPFEKSSERKWRMGYIPYHYSATFQVAEPYSTSSAPLSPNLPVPYRYRPQNTPVLQYGWWFVFTKFDGIICRQQKCSKHPELHYHKIY